ncbi:MAG: STM3941 family protein [Patescibacteria group bacterium]
MNNKVFIKSSVKSRLVGFFGSIFFIIIGVIFVQTLNNSFGYKVIGIAAFLFGLISLILFIVSLVTHKSGVIITSEGIKDNSALICPRFVRWSDLEKVKYNGLLTKMMFFYPKDMSAFLAEQNLFFRFTFKANVRMFGAPFAIAQQNIAVPLEQLIEEVRKYTQVEM